ncbi:hypothetical protein [Citrobacter braakii]|uniref:hypothetical protein n=1 Tax=Citrobacter braakii TaxID=57706 RepID=UPI0019041085|nr:hypothetical protein [Citrobacter braakii]MBJ9569080.1 hypothetical protein [Citrobacter braakii]HCR4042780.1 hypothetical protein [Citrobacter freundii]
MNIMSFNLATLLRINIDDYFKSMVGSKRTPEHAGYTYLYHKGHAQIIDSLTPQSPIRNINFIVDYNQLNREWDVLRVVVEDLNGNNTIY